MFRLVLTAWLFACVQSWTLTSSHPSVVPGFTLNVTLRCFDDGNHTEDFQHIDLIRIEKFGADNAWHIFAVRILGNTPVSPMGDGVSSSGHVGDPKDSFLSVTWSEAQEDTVGLYRCNIVGTNQNSDYIRVSNLPANITAKPLSLADVLQLALSYKKLSTEVHEIIQSLKVVVARHEQNRSLLNETLGETRDVLVKFKADHDRYNSSLKEIPRAFTSDLNISIENILDDYLWPEGPVAFPAPETGCPDDLISDWLPGHLTLDRSAGFFHPNFSDGNHLLKPLTSGPGNLQMRFCKKESVAGRAWPRGAYCFAQAGQGPCPFGLTTSRMSFRSNNNSARYNLKVASVNGPHAQVTDTNALFSFCCRRDASSLRQIFLPIERPFYLYRHSGDCQAVRNADVTSESLTLATVFEELSVEFLPGQKLSPDGHNGTLELCYYTPRTV